MLEFTEKLRKELRTLRRDAEEAVLSGRVADMAQYKHMMGRLEGYKFVEDVVNRLLNEYPED